MQRIALLLVVLSTGCSAKVSRISAALVYGQPTVSIEFHKYDSAVSPGYRVAGTVPVTVK